MSITEIVILLALTGYAIYRQSVSHAVVGRTRFKLALVYAAVGLAVGGFYLPPDGRAWLVLLVGLVASLVVGLVRGRLSLLTLRPDGVVLSRGTPLTIGLFVALVASKYAWGAWEFLHHAHPHGGFGEVLLQIAAMAALQAEVVWRRALALRPGHGPARDGFGAARRVPEG
ncbi:hypothetical protein V4F39_11360 [Aquincola sp. MAHUQ-54]|uniref:DUF1453 domain-containing protein n=1 Tax=Aquincola agrisoli TaxID=3119538 RepID=A0AAW9QGJ2_9BURK